MVNVSMNFKRQKLALHSPDEKTFLSNESSDIRIIM